MFKSLIDKYPLYASALIFGGLGAINSFLYFFFLIAFKMYPFSGVYFITFIINALFIVISIWYFRYLLNNYVFHFWQALSVGIAANLIQTFIYCAIVAGFISSFAPDFLQVYIDVEQQKFLLDKPVFIANISESQFNEMLKSIEQISMSDIIIRLGKINGSIGIIVVLIASMLLRRKEILESPLNTPPTKK